MHPVEDVQSKVSCVREINWLSNVKLCIAGVNVFADVRLNFMDCDHCAPKCNIIGKTVQSPKSIFLYSSYSSSSQALIMFQQRIFHRYNKLRCGTKYENTTLDTVIVIMKLIIIIISR